ncbi:MAG TPA: hypothetical protein VJ124_21830 [Pyrinomonadaceae bacterium]|nr:hypothetical protein [Pyrinomonadaceae bacterium]
MNEDVSIPQMTRAEQETETEATRLIEQIEGALAAVAVRTSDQVQTLEAAADRIERASRDLAFALRELAQSRRLSENETA